MCCHSLGLASQKSTSCKSIDQGAWITLADKFGSFLMQPKLSKYPGTALPLLLQGSEKLFRIPAIHRRSGRSFLHQGSCWHHPAQGLQKHWEVRPTQQHPLPQAAAPRASVSLSQEVRTITAAPPRGWDVSGSTASFPTPSSSLKWNNLKIKFSSLDKLPAQHLGWTP